LEEIPAEATHLLVVDEYRLVAQGPKRQMLRLWRERVGERPMRSGLDRLQKSSFRSRTQRPFGEALVEFEGVTVKAGRKRILDEITWTLREGECWALLGPNGAGKTTFLSLIQGDHPQAYSQRIQLLGRRTGSTQTLWTVRQQLGWMSPELHQHYPAEWSALDVVCSGFFNTVGLYRPCSRRQHDAAQRWLLDLGLARHARQAFGELSFGQQRLVLLARAVIKQPRLLMLDEPCQGMDALQRHALLAAVDRVVAQTGCGLIFVTHHAREVPRCITHVLRIAAGRCLFRSSGSAACVPPPLPAPSAGTAW
jgi:molybdate transport system ATP-binding protein